MKTGLLGILILLAFNGNAQNFRDQNRLLSFSTNKTEYYLNRYLKTSSEQSDLSTSSIFSLIDKLENKRTSIHNDKKFLHYLFFKTHQKLLKHYTPYCSFEALIKNGTYNCLSGTALYALLLDRFKIGYKIIETNYHIFILATMGADQVLFEATDPLNGYVDSKEEINQRINSYRNLASGDKGSFYHYQFNIYNEVNLDELSGLMYYNFSVVAYNAHELSKAINYLDLAAKLYQSPRIEEFSKLIFLTIREGHFKDSEKEIYLKEIQSLRSKMFVLASAN